MTRKERQTLAEQRRQVIREKIEKYLNEAYNATHNLVWSYKRCSDYAYFEIIKKTSPQELSFVTDTVKIKLLELKTKYSIKG